MKTLEEQYLDVGAKILKEGVLRAGRNGNTLALFGPQLRHSMSDGFPLLTTRKIYHKGILGELAAFYRSPTCVDDFEEFGCNYWKLWADENGALDLHYGVKWFDFNGTNQFKNVIESLKNDQTSRRHMIIGWDPSTLDQVSLHSCHMLYQFFVADGQLHLSWYQRSADWAIGVPSDLVLAATMLITIANEVRLVPGEIIMTFGDSHLYEEHTKKFSEQLKRKPLDLPEYVYKAEEGDEATGFIPDDIEILDYIHLDPIKYELKA